MTWMFVQIKKRIFLGQGVGDYGPWVKSNSNYVVNSLIGANHTHS